MDEINGWLHHRDGGQGHQMSESLVTTQAPLSNPHVGLQVPQQIDEEIDLTALYVLDA